jgi:hypothetical protein
VRNELRVVGELREGTWGSSTHVVSSGGLREPLQESNKENDLPLGGSWKSIPLLWRGTGIEWEWCSIRRNWPWEVDSVGLDNVTDESSHGDTSVLNLSLTQKSDGFIVGVAPDSDTGKLKRIIVLL